LIAEYNADLLTHSIITAVLTLGLAVEVIVIIAEPLVTAVTTPLGFTEAIFEFDEANVTVFTVAFEGSTVIAIVRV